MPYAEPADVKARAGVLAKAWDATTEPGDDEIDLFLAATSRDVDSLLTLYGVTLPLTEQLAGGLNSLVADGTLLLMLDATWPGTEGRAGVNDLRERVLERYGPAYAALKCGEGPLFAAARGEAPGLHATSLWTEGGVAGGGRVSVGPISRSVMLLDQALTGCYGLSPEWYKGMTL